MSCGRLRNARSRAVKGWGKYMIRVRGMPPATIAAAWLAGQRMLPQPRHVFVCVADHFEPEWRGATDELRRSRVARWIDEYPRSVEGIADSRGRPPQHSFFYPMECYRGDLLEALANLTRAGFGDIEVHVHHDNDNSQRFRQFLLDGVEKLHQRHGLLSRDAQGKLVYGFIHGNWALDNSHPDGRHCGVNDELTVLRETGCYADFTMPAAPHAAQTRTINQIYYAVDDPQRPKSHDRGSRAGVDFRPPRDSLLMIQGPLLITQHRPWQRPRIENGNLSGAQPPSRKRIEQWLRAQVCVRGHADWSFIKLHTHGAQEANACMLLGPVMREFHQALSELARERDFQYYYVTARELAQLVRQAERACPRPDFERLGWEG